MIISQLPIDELPSDPTELINQIVEQLPTDVLPFDVIDLVKAILDRVFELLGQAVDQIIDTIDVDDINDVLDQVQSTVDQINEDIEELTGVDLNNFGLSTINENIDSLQEDIGNISELYESDINNIKDVLDRTTDEITQLTQENVNLNEIIDGLNIKIADKDVLNNELTQQVDELTGINNTLKVGLSLMNGKITGIINKMNQLREQHDKLLDILTGL